MAFALAKENERFISEMVRAGRFNNQSEVVREALRRMERDEKSYLNPPPLTKAQLAKIYGPDPQSERLERIAGRRIAKSIRKLVRKHGGIDQL
jgi:putative addiction module CopG family antidote